MIFIPRTGKICHNNAKDFRLINLSLERLTDGYVWVILKSLPSGNVGMDSIISEYRGYQSNEKADEYVVNGFSFDKIMPI